MFLMISIVGAFGSPAKKDTKLNQEYLSTKNETSKEIKRNQDQPSAKREVIVPDKIIKRDERELEESKTADGETRESLDDQNLRDLEERINRIKTALDRLRQKPRQIDSLYRAINSAIFNYAQNQSPSRLNSDRTQPNYGQRYESYPSAVGNGYGLGQNSPSLIDSFYL